MARPAGSKNKTAEEIRLDAELLKKKAEAMKHKAEIKALMEKKEKLKSERQVKSGVKS